MAVNLYDASYDDIKELPGIGNKRASAIISIRKDKKASLTFKDFLNSPDLATAVQKLIDNHSICCEVAQRPLDQKGLMSVLNNMSAQLITRMEGFEKNQADLMDRIAGIESRETKHVDRVASVESNQAKNIAGTLSHFHMRSPHGEITSSILHQHLRIRATMIKQVL